MNKTRSIKEKEIQNKWLIIDAKGVRLGKLSTIVASLLMGKKKVNNTTNLFCGDRVAIINAKLVDLNKTTESKKTYSWHSGYPGGINTKTIKELLERRPDYVFKRAVRGMLPKNRMGRKMLSNLRVFADSNHDLEAQKPEYVKI